jgi:carboxylesterase
VRGLVLVNAALRFRQEPLMLTLGYIGFPVRWLPAVGNDISKPGEDECAYEKLPIRASRQLALLMRGVRRDVSSVTCPILIFSSAKDHVVPVANQKEIYEKVGSTEKVLVRLEKSFHCATMDYEAEAIFTRSLDFVRAHLPE